jgi:hypothetical protein
LQANERTIPGSWLRFKAVSWPSRVVAIEDLQPINLNPRHPFYNSRDRRWESEIRVSAFARSKETDNGHGGQRTIFFYLVGVIDSQLQGKIVSSFANNTSALSKIVSLM